MKSRVARAPIKLPAGVDVQIAATEITVKGKLGELKETLPPVIKIVKAEGELKLSAAETGEPNVNTIAGTMRALIQNMVQGVSVGFSKKLVLVGVGYRAKVQGNALDISVGFSHPYVMKMPKGITVETPTNTEIVVKGADVELVSQIAANIRAVRPPEPYKGKGIRYENERIELKEGKKK